MKGTRTAGKAGDVIAGHTQYILCTRNNRLHRKAIQVCYQCRHRKTCNDFKKILVEETAEKLNRLISAFDRTILTEELLDAFRKELLEIKALC